MDALVAKQNLDTREALLLAAEHLFGLHGLDGTSMRGIGALAGQANVSVVQYYFDSKEDLASQILNWRVSLMEPLRQEQLERALMRPEGQRLYDLVTALYLPVLSFKDSHGHHSFARFLCKYMTTLRAHGVAHPEDARDRTPQLDRTIKEMERELHFLPPELVRMRSTKEMIGFLSLIILHDNGADFFGWHPSIEEIIEESLRTTIAALIAPPHCKHSSV